MKLKEKVTKIVESTAEILLLNPDPAPFSQPPTWSSNFVQGHSSWGKRTASQLRHYFGWLKPSQTNSTCLDNAGFQ